MTKASRLSTIMQLIDTEGSVQLRDLMDRFQVTDMTIRRDFDQLEAEGRIIRVHGGAVSAAPEATAPSAGDAAPPAGAGIRDAGRAAVPAADPAAAFAGDAIALGQLAGGQRMLEPSYLSRLQANLAQKRELAESCLPLLKQKDFVFLDSGTTTLCIAQELSPEISSTIITNGVNITAELLTHSVQNVINIGGEVFLNTWAAKGPLAESQLQNFHADIAFLGCNAVSPEGNVMIGNMAEISIKRIVMSISREIYLVADSSKFDTYSLTSYASVRDFNGIITDRSLSDDIRLRLGKLGANFI